jgi:hypothetical protein
MRLVKINASSITYDARSIRERSLMSYSFQEPEWPAFCECKYDETRDEMDREDCLFHCCMTNDAPEEQPLAARKRQARIDSAKESAA